MTETELLIAEVEKYPILWDVNDENYCNKTLRDRTWIEICMKLQPNWDDLSCDDKLEACDSKKRQWNNVRDGYRKYFNRIKSVPVDAAMKMKKYIYADNLQFLIKVLANSKPREGNYYRRTIDLLDDRHTKKGKIEVKKEDEEEISRRKLQRREEKARVKMKKTKNDGNSQNIQKQILNLVKQNSIENFKDEDSLFLLSFRSDMKLMSWSEKLQFKLGLVQLVQSITENRQCDSPSSSSQSYVYAPEVVYAATPSPTREEDKDTTAVSGLSEVPTEQEEPKFAVPIPKDKS